jgi:ribosomal protein L37E
VPQTYHTHECASCGNVWGHWPMATTPVQNKAMHTCRVCGAEQYWVAGFPLSNWLLLGLGLGALVALL